MGSQDILGYDDLQHLRIRLTEYSKVHSILGATRYDFGFLDDRLFD